MGESSERNSQQECLLQPAAIGDERAVRRGNCPAERHHFPACAKVFEADECRSFQDFVQGEHFPLGQLQRQDEASHFQRIPSPVAGLVHRTRGCSRVGALTYTQPRPEILRHNGSVFSALERGSDNHKANCPQRIASKIGLLPSYPLSNSQVHRQMVGVPAKIARAEKRTEDLEASELFIRFHHEITDKNIGFAIHNR